ncbi:hypothetical protein PIECOFPK_01557 [Mycovorax composti]|uniref:Acyl-CoA reductase n=2 Tax=Mycovorax composti TaxID=2962693 RepID=A0ABZ2EJW2_9BACT
MLTTNALLMGYNDRNMELIERIDLLVKLGTYMKGNDQEWIHAKEQAYIRNSWFTPEFINLSIKNISELYLQKDALIEWINQYPTLKSQPTQPKTIGIVMAGNIPLVGFHDFLCVFISGHKCRIKLSSKDEIILKHLVDRLSEWSPQLKEQIEFAEMLKNCDAYIATGSNSSAGYFEYYFGKYPHIIRRNRTSAAILNGDETTEELERLADDIFLYFGLGCRNVTKLYVPEQYDFAPLIQVLKKYDYLAEHHKYKNNYDYNLALHILNKKYYMSTAALLLIEDANLFSPAGQVHYEYYTNREALLSQLSSNESVQCIVGKGGIPFGMAQYPSLNDYADGVDTMQWIEDLN